MAEGTVAPAGDLTVKVIRTGSRDDDGGQPPAALAGAEPVQPVGQVEPKRVDAAEIRAIRDRFDQLISASGVLWPAKILSVKEIAHFGLPQRGLDERVNAWRAGNVRHLWRGVRRALLARSLGLSNFYGSLWLRHLRADGDVLDLGLASMRVVTTAGVGFIVDAFQNSVELENMKYHGLGTDNTAEASSDTALIAELTTQYNPNSTRATGSTTEGSANVYRTVGTNTVDASAAVVEHGVLSQAATGGGVLLDRTVFSTVNLASADSLQTTYDLTLTAGS